MGRTFTNCENRCQGNLPDLEVSRTHRRVLVWLLGSALTVVGAADALSAGRHKDSSSARHKESSSAASASSGENHKDRSGRKSASSRHKKESKAAAVEHHKHVIAQPAGEAAPLPPELVALKQAIELVRQGRRRTLPRSPHRSEIRLRRRSSNGHNFATETTRRASAATLLSSESIQIGR